MLPFHGCLAVSHALIIKACGGSVSAAVPVPGQCRAGAGLGMLGTGSPSGHHTLVFHPLCLSLYLGCLWGRRALQHRRIHQSSPAHHITLFFLSLLPHGFFSEAGRKCFHIKPGLSASILHGRQALSKTDFGSIGKKRP